MTANIKTFYRFSDACAYMATLTGPIMMRRFCDGAGWAVEDQSRPETTGSSVPAVRTKTPPLDCVLIAACTCDYFMGCNAPYVQIAAEPNMKLRDVKQAVEHALWEGGGNEPPLEGDEYDAWVRRALASIRRLSGTPRWFTTLSFCNDDNAETVWAYFKFVERV